MRYSRTLIEQHRVVLFPPPPNVPTPAAVAPWPPSRLSLRVLGACHPSVAPPPSRTCWSAIGEPGRYVCLWRPWTSSYAAGCLTIAAARRCRCRPCPRLCVAAVSAGAVARCYRGSPAAVSAAAAKHAPRCVSSRPRMAPHRPAARGASARDLLPARPPVACPSCPLPGTFWRMAAMPKPHMCPTENPQKEQNSESQATAPDGRAHLRALFARRAAAPSGRRAGGRARRRNTRRCLASGRRALARGDRF